MTIAEMKTKHSELTAKIYKTKTKKAIAKLVEARNELEIAMEDYYSAKVAPYDNKRMTGVIAYSGTEVMVKTEIGAIEINACNDVLSKSWYNETCCVHFKAGSTVEFTLKVYNVNHRGVEFGCADVSGGIFDAEQYAKLIQNPNLAFFKYPGTDGVTGFFNHKKEA